jgi:hypothetical protein
MESLIWFLQKIQIQPLERLEENGEGPTGAAAGRPDSQTIVKT